MLHIKENTSLIINLLVGWRIAGLVGGWKLPLIDAAGCWGYYTTYRYMYMSYVQCSNKGMVEEEN